MQSIYRKNHAKQVPRSKTHLENRSFENYSKKYDQNGCCIFNNSFYALPIVQIIMLAITEYLMKNIFQIGKEMIISYPIINESKNYLDFYLQLEPRLNLYVEICCP